MTGYSLTNTVNNLTSCRTAKFPLTEQVFCTLHWWPVSTASQPNFVTKVMPSVSAYLVLLCNVQVQYTVWKELKAKTKVSACLTKLSHPLLLFQTAYFSSTSLWSFLCLSQTCQPLVKENLERKISEILFFPRSNPFSIETPDTNFISSACSPFKLADRQCNRCVALSGRTRRKTISCWTQGKITTRYKKVVSTVFFLCLSLTLYGTSTPRKYASTISFQKDFSQKTVRLGALS